jgi:hypothetical protein
MPGGRPTPRVGARGLPRPLATMGSVGGVGIQTCSG